MEYFMIGIIITSFIFTIIFGIIIFNVCERILKKKKLLKLTLNRKRLLDQCIITKQLITRRKT